MPCSLSLILLLLPICGAFVKNYRYLDICGNHNAKKFYIDYGTSGVLLADFENRAVDSGGGFTEGKCTVDFITCPSCVIEIKFKYLNISRTCNKSPMFSECNCDYLLIYETSYKDASGEQFCGKFLKGNASELEYTSKTRFVTVDYIFTQEYGRAFSLEFTAKRNRVVLEGYPKWDHMNNLNQNIMSPYFPHRYPSDLNTEHVIECHSREPCRISIIFTDFLIAESSILEFFDFNGQRMYVISGNIFRPLPVVTSGPSLTMRFYANGATNMGFKATYSFILSNLDASAFKPNLGCGGEINNLGGGITMMNMVPDKAQFFDCIWIIKPPVHFLYRKTHLYVKVTNFSDFAGMAELVLRQGLTSSEPAVEVLRYPLSRFNPLEEKEHVVPINQGFYINLRGLFKPQSRVALVYAAFNYKECFSGLDFLCHNMRCISTLLNCDGFDHCGDNSDESADCTDDPRDHREFSKIPNFLFPKAETYGDLTTATIIFFTCTFGLIGVIFAMALVLYRVNIRARHQRQIQDHMETINAILEEGAIEMEEEISISDDPPDYEPPPEYSDVIQYIRKVTSGNLYKQKSRVRHLKTCSMIGVDGMVASSSRSCQTTPVKTPQSPPPDYEQIHATVDVNQPGTSSNNIEPPNFPENVSNEETSFLAKLKDLRRRISTCEIAIISRRHSIAEEKLRGYFSDSELPLKFNSKKIVSNRRNYSSDDILTVN
ncbi:CUB and LDLa domain [Rhynchophorus ferrugineus]|uniref:CUB and LDLa domain n=1 Tax=Rhynchophorus ferrugineus TaxID=354439 RepID=UPI003FCD1815